VTVKQDNIVASSDATTTVRRDSDRGWWLDVSSSAQFTHGPARAHAVVVVRKTDRTTYQWPWSFNVQLVQLDPALGLKEIQVNILAGFHKDYASFCSLRFRLTRPTHVSGCMAAWSSSASPSTSWIDFR
jgi:hypothetical protein